MKAQRIVSHRRYRRGSQIHIGLVAVLACLLPALAFAGSGGTSSTDSMLVTHWGDDTVGVVNVAKGTLEATIAVGPKPYDIQIEPSGKYAYTTLSGAAEVSVIDLEQGVEISRIPVGRSPRDLDLSADGTLAYVANSGDDNLSVVDLVDGQELYTIPVGLIPYGVALAQGESTLLVTNWGENTVSILRQLDGSWQTAATLPVGSLPYTVAATANGNTAYLTNFGSGTVTPVDLEALATMADLPVGQSPWGLAVSPEEDFVVVANFYDDNLSLIQLPTSSQSEISLGAAARRAKNAAVSTAFIVAGNLAANELMVVDRQTMQVVRTIPVGKAPYGLAFLPANTAVATAEPTGYKAESMEAR